MVDAGLLEFMLINLPNFGGFILLAWMMYSINSKLLEAILNLQNKQDENTQAIREQTESLNGHQ